MNGGFMFREEVVTVSSAAKAKLNLLNNNPVGYFVSSMLAGGYVGLAIILIYTIGGLLQGAPATKVLMGACFGIALSLVIMAGSELFTGNVFVMSLGIVKKTVTLKDSIRLWIVCLLGNWAGSILVATLFVLSGLSSGATASFVANVSEAKMTIPLMPLFVRAILCNILVCLAVWSSYKLKSESGKLIMIFWCLFAFITSSYEHSIANMTLLTIALYTPAEAAVSFGGYFYNILVVVLGNFVGAAAFLALPYALISREKPCVDCEKETKLAESPRILGEDSLVPHNVS